ncbi:hypothetical protein, partial [Streptomyces sp. NPDC047968]|uniref:hypothetical protein n=1 Tax=Streptomyces sp. NPDC047968 TaxID=3155382 RepID=UPI00341495A2
MSEPRTLTAADVRALLGGPGSTQRTARGADGKEAPTLLDPCLDLRLQDRRVDPVRRHVPDVQRLHVLP